MLKSLRALSRIFPPVNNYRPVAQTGVSLGKFATFGKGKKIILVRY